MGLVVVRSLDCRLFVSWSWLSNLLEHANRAITLQSCISTSRPPSRNQQSLCSELVCLPATTPFTWIDELRFHLPKLKRTYCRGLKFELTEL